MEPVPNLIIGLCGSLPATGFPAPRSLLYFSSLCFDP
jgi:hypothetical protein